MNTKQNIIKELKVEKVGKKNPYKVETYTITDKILYSMITDATLKYFRSRGGYEKFTGNYNTNSKLISIDPSRTEKHVHYFRKINNY